MATRIPGPAVGRSVCVLKQEVREGQGRGRRAPGRRLRQVGGASAWHAGSWPMGPKRGLTIRGAAAASGPADWNRQRANQRRGQVSPNGLRSSASWTACPSSIGAVGAVPYPSRSSEGDPSPVAVRRLMVTGSRWQASASPLGSLPTEGLARSRPAPEAVGPPPSGACIRGVRGRLRWKHSPCPS